MPPEVLSGKDIKSSPAIDIWAVGVLMYELYTGRLPFAGAKQAETRRAILEDEVAFPEEDFEIHPKARALIGSMLEKDKSKRVKMAQVLENSWLFPPCQTDDDQHESLETEEAGSPDCMQTIDQDSSAVVESPDVTRPKRA